MARKKQEDAPKGSPAWMTTFSDLMNLLLCFFVLLFSMSTVDVEKFELVIASLESAFSILPSGGNTVEEEGQMISSGISQLEYFDVYFDASKNKTGNHTTDDERSERDPEQAGKSEKSEVEEMSAEELQEALEEKALAESEAMAEQIEQLAEEQQILAQMQIDFNSQYVVLTLNGALLFDSGQAELKEDAYALVDKIGLILQNYNSNTIEIEGHTDNVPIHNSEFGDNNVLSAFRALNVMEYLTETTNLDPAKLKSSGRGEYVPVADNSTVEGRAKNRRVEIKIYNTFSSDD